MSAVAENQLSRRGPNANRLVARATAVRSRLPPTPTVCSRLREALSLWPWPRWLFRSCRTWRRFCICDDAQRHWHVCRGGWGAAGRCRTDGGDVGRVQLVPAVGSLLSALTDVQNVLARPIDRRSLEQWLATLRAMDAEDALSEAQATQLMHHLNAVRVDYDAALAPA
jgi:hypothetical protein